jgi:hypothetical protein
MRTTTLCGAALIVLLTGAASARAGLVHWSYDWSSSPGQVFSDGAGTSKITLSDEKRRSVVGDSDVVATNLRTYSTAPDSNPDHFTNKAYHLSLAILDIQSNSQGTITFSGLFNGTVSAHSANIKNTLTTPTSQSVILGNYRYTAHMDFFAPPGPPGVNNAGSISAHVAIDVDLIHHMPEPSSLLLAGLGVVLLGLARNRTWRRVPLRVA